MNSSSFFPELYTTLDFVHIAILFAIDGSALIFNIILVFAILTRTPKYLLSYSVFLLSNTLVDIVSATASALGTIRLVNTHTGQVIFVSIGPCVWIGYDFCHLSHCVHLTLASQSIVILFLSFCYRLYIVGDAATPRENPLRSRCWAICFVFSLPRLAVIYFFWITGEETPIEVRREYGIEGYVAVWLPRMSDVRAAVPIFYYVFCAPISMTLIFLVRRRLVACIATVDASMRGHHKRIAQALTYQMLLPSGLLVGATMWVVDLTQIYSSQLLEHSMLVVVSLFALASPIINLYFLPPYRSLSQHNHPKCQAPINHGNSKCN